MIMQQFRWLFTLICIMMRGRVSVDVVDENYVIEHTYGEVDSQVTYVLRVVERVYRINYKRFWLPNITRRVYKATVTHKVNGEIVCVYSDTYPPLSGSLVSLVVDDAYALSAVADIHLKKYLEE